MSSLSSDLEPVLQPNTEAPQVSFYFCGLQSLKICLTSIMLPDIFTQIHINAQLLYVLYYNLFITYTSIGDHAPLLVPPFSHRLVNHSIRDSITYPQILKPVPLWGYFVHTQEHTHTHIQIHTHTEVPQISTRKTRNNRKHLSVMSNLKYRFDINLC